MTAQILAGDVGGTKTLLALYAFETPDRLVLIREASYPSRSYQGLEDVVKHFLELGDETVDAAAFGIAAPILGTTITTTNLPWKIELSNLAATVGCQHLRVLNDLETTAYGALHLPSSKLSVLQEGIARRGNCAVIAAGTGLGQSVLYWDGSRHHPSATEGGHVDFAARNDAEAELLRFLRKLYPRVSYERALSGPGLLNIVRYLQEVLGKPVNPAVRERMQTEDPSAVIGEAGVAGTCPTCAEAVETFLRIYGAQAGNLALSVLAVGGMYVGGGIILKLLPKLASSGFLQAFHDKGRYSGLMTEIPIRILLEPKTALLGAARAAIDLLG